MSAHSEMMMNHLAILERGHGSEMCRDVDSHAREPQGYSARFEWAMKKLRTHTQQRCPTCGFWVIWKRKGKST